MIAHLVSTQIVMWDIKALEIERTNFPPSVEYPTVSIILPVMVWPQGDVRRQGPRIEANRKELNFILILCGGGQVIITIIMIMTIIIASIGSSPTFSFAYHHIVTKSHGVIYQGGSNKQLGEKIASDVGRQIRQADVMLKSAVLLTKRWWWLHWMIMTEILQSYQEMIWTSAVTELLGYQNTFKFWTKKPLWLWRKLTWKANSGDCDFVWNSHSGNSTSMWSPTASSFTDGWSTGASDKIQMSCRYFSNSENLP